MSEFTTLIKIVTGGLVTTALVTTMPTLMRTMTDELSHATQPAASPPPPSDPIDGTTVAIVGVIALALVVAAAVIFVLYRRHTARTVEHRAAQARLATQTGLWQQAITTLGDTSEALMEFENDPESVYFTRRLLADVNEPATAAFYTAYGTAQSLRTETIPADTDIIVKFVDAANAARRAFDAADENARRKARLGISHDGHRLTTDERHKIDQSQKLMRQAHDPAVTEAAAHNALTKALSLLDAAGVIVPERLTANVTTSIATIHRRALTS